MVGRRRPKKIKNPVLVRILILYISLYMLIPIYLQINMHFDKEQECTVDKNVNATGNLTLVTAYFDIGSFRKGVNQAFYKENYLHWIQAYRYVLNPIIVYTDSVEFARRFSDIRRNFQHRTKIIKIDRKKLWSFRISHRIKEIFSQPNYPQFYPNTVNPKYSSVQHSKYELMTIAIKNKIFKNAFYAWIDVGYFRDIIHKRLFFEMIPPDDIDKSKIAVNQISQFNTNLTLSEIFKGNEIWVGGGMFIGTPGTLKQFSHIYKRAVSYFLDQNLINTDQQILYAIYQRDGKTAIHPDVELQAYKPKDYNGDPWFYLGYHCRRVIEAWKCF